MSRGRSVAVAVLGTILVAPAAVAQSPRMTPAEIVRTIDRRGGVNDVLSQLAFEECPQDDARGRETLELVSDMELPPEDVWRVLRVWVASRIECEYGPLNDWYDARFRELLASGDRTHASVAMQSFGQRMPDALREELWQRVGQQPDWGIVEAEMVGVALADPTPHGWVSRGIDAFARRDVPRELLRDRVTELLLEHPTIFIRTLTSRVDRFSDDRLLMVLQVIHVHIRGQSLGAQAPGINALRWAIRDREGIPGVELLGPVN